MDTHTLSDVHAHILWVNGNMSSVERTVKPLNSRRGKTPPKTKHTTVAGIRLT